MEIQRKHVVLGILGAVVVLFVLVIVVIFILPKKTEEVAQEEVVETPVENLNINGIIRPVFYDEDGQIMTGTGQQLAEEGQVEDPYYFFNQVGASYDALTRGLEQGDMEVVRDRAERMAFDLQRMYDVAEGDILKDQVQTMLLRALTFRETLKKNDPAIVEEAWRRLKPIRDLRATLLDEELKSRQ